jgi:hypothetical protein
MTEPPSTAQSAHGRVLAEARELAEQVRLTAERVHRQALEAHRLTDIARREAERGRELLRAGRREARSVNGSIEWSLDTGRQTGRHLSDKNED